MSDFICHVREGLEEGTRKRGREACKSLNFYGEHENEQYCVLHLPIEEKKDDFTRTIEAKLNRADYNFRGAVFPADTAQFAGYKFDGDVDFSDATFCGEVNFQGTEFAGENIWFANAKFAGGNIWFIDAKFRGDTLFARAEFAGEWTYFSNAVFEGEVTAFFETKFDSKNTFFSHARFLSTEVTDFQKAKFSGSDVGFVGTEFSGRETYFTKTKFDGVKTDFSGAKFLSSAVTRFSDAQFSGESTLFRRGRFASDRTELSHIQFSSEQTDFSAATFRSSQRSETIDFSGAQFGGESTSFMGAVLESKLIQFSDTRFVGSSTLFIGTKVSGQDTYFSRTEFSADNSVFTGAKFASKHTHFTRTKFSSEETSFENTSFSGEVVLFNEARLKGKVAFRKNSKILTFTGEDEIFGSQTWVHFDHCWIDEPERLTFSNVVLHPGWFINVDVRDADFTDVKWYGMPGGPKGNLGEDIDALKRRGVESPNTLLAQACRRLSANAEENREYPLANEFHYWSMDALRIERWRYLKWLKRFIEKNWRRISRRFGLIVTLLWIWRIFRREPLRHKMPSRFGLVPTFYWALSGYGVRAGRAFLVLGGMLLAFAVMYTLLGPHKLQFIQSAVVYSLLALARLNPEPRPEEPGVFQFLVGLEGILGPLQIALLALAIRRKVMR